MSKNRISSLPDSFLHLRKLRTLDLTENPELASEFQEKITASQEKCDVLLHKMITVKSVTNKSVAATRRSSSPLQPVIEEARPSLDKQLQDALAKNQKLEARVAAQEAQIVQMQEEHRQALSTLQKNHEQEMTESNL